ncbi:sigma-70 family RNA polymerase sigma factor [Aureibaculum conchae]|uniref:sigma-70 family RNA polymerase sigma factor n=1 Tax=Aureibaculum sp. 2308TA14-22 TaxID=3108392 RepID=UPI0033987E61
MKETNTIWKTYSDDVQRFILSKTKDETITDDLLQEIFIKVHTKISNVQDLTKIKSWLFTVANNTVMDYFRATKKNHVTLDDNIAKKDIEDFDNQTADFYEHTEHDCLYGIVKSLDKKYRDPLFMSDIQGYKQQEIAEILKLPLPTVKSQIQRARKMIAQGFMDCCGYQLNEKGKLVGEIKSKEDCKVCS